MKRQPQLARSDLLQALALAGDDDERQRRYAGLLEFVERPANVASISGVITVAGGIYCSVGPAPEPPPESAADRLSAPLFAITACRRLELPAEASEAARPAALTDARCAPRERHGEAAPFVPLVRRTRLWPALKHSLLEVHRRGVDLPRLLRELARAQAVRRLPAARQATWGGELLVVWDLARHLQPYQDDFAAIVTELRQQRGDAGCTLWLVDGSPQQIRQRWPVPPSSTCRSPAAIPPPAPGSRVLILSDAGALAGWPQATRDWSGFARRLVAGGAQPVFWAPLAPAQIEVELARRARVFCLQPRGDLRRQRGRLADEEQRQAERQRLAALRERLLARMACCIRVEPALLRALRGITPATANEPALEALVWNHPPVVYDSLVSRAVTAAHVARYRQDFEELAAAEQLAALEQTLHIHAWRGRATEATELLVWQAHARDEAKRDAADRIAEAERWFAALGARASQAGRTDPQLRQYARDLLARNAADFAWLQAHSRALSPVWVASGEKTAPAGLRSEHLLQAISERDDLPLLACELGVQAQGLVLFGGGERPAGPAHSRLGSPLRARRLLVSEGGPTRALDPDPAGRPQLVAPLPSLADPDRPLTVTAGQHSYLIRRVERPVWAQEIGRDAHGLYAIVEIPGQARKASAGAKAVVQRLRYIEAGHFRMGSPESEPERYDDEGPQHSVTLSAGFWLADTACTQALWETVMGKNPSYFKLKRGGGPRHPVEQVSWNDVQRFLRTLEQRLPGAIASLPSEAEWEYACRAGTSTAFHFGDQITPEQVNYDGNYPYAGGRKGLYRESTVPVGSLPANAWGLYEMHGNVWEWCADGRRTYAGRDETDPRGPEGEGVAGRALRGGAWYDDAWNARSANRDAYAPDSASRDDGFRFALRSTSPAGATEWPAPRSGVDGAAGRGTVAAPGTGAATSFPDPFDRGRT
ncbi:formylglycine-generating enzyme family protein [Accumulibacter sp.]|uniref:formylglycine-generating enzyme family protein n=1 Tax=Accumulibacter sp. TaxID=2053492 RepID=UPI002587AFC5|nr:formylglycine-generating enzyme family protein [Accumulibacter sp.]